MDELSGNTIEIVLSIKEGLGFGFLRVPIVICCSLNGHILETDPTLPKRNTIFDSELIWETTKRAFKSLRLKNTPLKLEVIATGCRGKPERIGYILLSLLAAKPRPGHRNILVNHAWHRVLGVGLAGKSLNPQILLRLTIEDGSSNVMTPSTPILCRNPIETDRSAKTSDFIEIPLSARTLTNIEPSLVPRIQSEGFIQIGNENECRDNFILSLYIQNAENLDLLLPVENYTTAKQNVYFSLVIFSDTVIMEKCNLPQKPIALNIKTNLSSLSLYFRDVPHAVLKILFNDKEIGVCCCDLRKMVPTDDLTDFLTNFCNETKSFSLTERYFIMSCASGEIPSAVGGKKPFIDLEISLTNASCVKLALPLGAPFSPVKTHDGNKPEVQPVCEAIQTLDVEENKEETFSTTKEYQEVFNVVTSNEVESQDHENVAEFPKPSDTVSLDQKALEIQKDLNEVLKKVNSLTPRCQGKSTTTRTNQDQHCQYADSCVVRSESCLSHRPSNTDEICSKFMNANERTIHRKFTAKSYTASQVAGGVKDLSPRLKENLIMKVVNELEDWKERQEELFKSYLKEKEADHLETIVFEWEKCCAESQTKLKNDVQQCESIILQLKNATEELDTRETLITERENKFRHAKEELEVLYTSKYYDLNESSRRMEDDFKHQAKLQALKYLELEVQMKYLEKANATLAEKNSELEDQIQAVKRTGLSNEQQMRISQEMKCLEEKLELALHSKAFFKDQWSAAVKELHLIKLNHQSQLICQVNGDKQQLYKMGLQSMIQKEESLLHQDHYSLLKLKDDICSTEKYNNRSCESSRTSGRGDRS